MLTTKDIIAALIADPGDGVAWFALADKLEEDRQDDRYSSLGFRVVLCERNL